MGINKWGVIYCPREGIKNHRRWKKICQYLRESQVSFDFVQSESQGSVERLAGMMTENGYQTIIVIGGDAALGDALNGILHAQSPLGAKPALGVIPNGFGNDFARFWGFTLSDYRGCIDQLKFRRTRRVDVGEVRLSHAGGTNVRYFLNCVNIGLAAEIIRLRRRANRLLGSQTLSYVVSAAQLLFKRKLFKMQFSISSENVKHTEMTVCIGSSTGYGQTPSAVPYNGLLDVTAVSHAQLAQVLQSLWLLFTGRFLTHKQVRIWRTSRVSFTDTGKAAVSIDGRVVHNEVKSLDITIHPEMIDFIIPE